jgi:hypothetical protein
VFPVSAKYRVHYLRKGGNGRFQPGDNDLLKPAASKKAAIDELISKDIVFN